MHTVLWNALWVSPLIAWAFLPPRVWVQMFSLHINCVVSFHYHYSHPWLPLLQRHRHSAFKGKHLGFLTWLSFWEMIQLVTGSAISNMRIHYMPGTNVILSIWSITNFRNSFALSTSPAFTAWLEKGSGGRWVTKARGYEKRLQNKFATSSDKNKCRQKTATYWLKIIKLNIKNSKSRN